MSTIAAPSPSVAVVTSTTTTTKTKTAAVALLLLSSFGYVVGSFRHHRTPFGLRSTSGAGSMARARARAAGWVSLRRRLGARLSAAPADGEPSSSSPSPSASPSASALGEYDGDGFYCEPHELWRVERVDRISDWWAGPSPSPSSSSSSSDGEDDDVVVPADPKPPAYPNPLSLKDNVPLTWFVDDDDAVAARVTVDARETDVEHDLGVRAEAFSMAGPRLEVAFDPAVSRAAIVTCGGLCPGLNTVVREVVMCLRRQYGVGYVCGVPGGYRGFKDPDAWRSLDEGTVSNLHNVGGSVLGSSRGGHDTDAIVDSLVARGIDVLFVVGGDGTVRGAAKIADRIKERALPISVAVVPKTIDNDVPLLDRTFGFETAVDAARNAIDVSNVEAEGFPYGLGVVKVMGRNSGFIAMHSALGSRVVDLCLVPEVPFYLDGPGGIVEHLLRRMVTNGKAIVVVAEGAGQDLIAQSGSGGDVIRDLSGNVLLDDVGPWLCRQLKSRLDRMLADEPTNVHGDAVAVKYVDPSYMVRGVPPCTADNVYCTRLAHNAVHGAMAGLTSFLVGSVNTRECYVPISLVADKRNVIDTAHQSLWEYVVFDTGQPSFAVEGGDGSKDEYDVLVSASGGVVLSTDPSS